MLIDILILSVIIGKIRKGRLGGDLDLRCPWIVVIAFFSQVTASLILGTPLKEIIFVCSYLLLIAFAVLNSKKSYIRILGLGIILNTLVIVLNGGRMPVSLAAAGKIGYDTTPLLENGYFKQQLLDGNTVLGFLGDIIPLYFPIPRVVSIGDLLIYLGVFLLVQDFMGCPINIRKKSTM